MEAYIIGGVRTAFGAFNGSLVSLDAVELAVSLRNLNKELISIPRMLTK